MPQGVVQRFHEPVDMPEGRRHPWCNADAAHRRMGDPDRIEAMARGEKIGKTSGFDAFDPNVAYGPVQR